MRMTGGAAPDGRLGRWAGGWRAGCACLFLLALNVAPGIIPGARAGEVEGLYEVQVPVTSQREAERADAVRAALQQVLVKVTGDRRTMTQQRVQALAQSPLKYVQQYLYRPLPPGYAATDAARPTQMLWVRFDAEAVNQLLRQADEPVWGRMRPSVLVWLAVDDEDGRHLVGGDAGSGVQADLAEQAQARGVPLLFPLLDLEDQRRVSFAAVQDGLDQEVGEASARYPAGAVLVGAVRHEPSGRWSGRWWFYLDGKAERWDSAAPQRAEALAAGVDGAADALATRFARASGGREAAPVDLLVTGIDKVEDYGRATRYLQELDAVSDLQVTAVDPAGVHFRLTLRGDRGDLAQAIAFGSVLAPAAPGGGADQELTYRLLQ
jgi:hypothetical protein